MNQHQYVIEISKTTADEAGTICKVTSLVGPFQSSGDLDDLLQEDEHQGEAWLRSHGFVSGATREWLLVNGSGGQRTLFRAIMRPLIDGDNVQDLH